MNVAVSADKIQMLVHYNNASVPENLKNGTQNLINSEYKHCIFHQNWEQIPAPLTVG